MKVSKDSKGQMMNPQTRRGEGACISLRTEGSLWGTLVLCGPCHQYLMHYVLRDETERERDRLTRALMATKRREDESNSRFNSSDTKLSMHTCT
jgi:hypothetical protein